MSGILKMHFVQDSSHDGYEVITACGLDGFRNDGISQYYQKRGSDHHFRAAFERVSVTCRRCLSSSEDEIATPPQPTDGLSAAPKAGASDDR
jgi:hypothetical protein